MNNDFFNFCIQQPKAGQRQLDKPTFYRDFILDPQLNGPATFGTQLPSMTRIGPDITFTRSSSATFINQEGNIQVVDQNVPRFEYEGHRTNLLSASNNINSNAWVGYWSKSPDWRQDAIGPDGVANSAWSLPLSSAIYGPSSISTGLVQHINQFIPLSGYPLTVSFWAKVDANFTGSGGLWFGINDDSSNMDYTVGNRINTNWQRFVKTGNYINRNNNLNDRGIQFVILSASNTNPNSKVYVYGFQCEVGSTATPYISTGATPVTVSRPKGLLIEEQKTNYVGQQNLFNWSQGGFPILSAGSGIAGLSSFIVGDDRNDYFSQIWYTFPTALLSSTTYVFSCYIKKNPNINNTYPVLRVYSPDNNVPYAGINFNQATGQAAIQPSYTLTSAVSVQDYNTYYRASFTFNTQSTAVPTQVEIIPSHGYGFGPTLSGTSIEVAGIQVEQGRFYSFEQPQGPVLTSYIPTNGSQVTRAADVATVSNVPAFFNSKEGTLYTEVKQGNFNVYGGSFVIDNGDVSNRVALFTTLGQIARNGIYTSVNNIAVRPGTIYSTTLGYSTSSIITITNASPFATNNSITLPRNLTTARIGSEAFGSFNVNGNIRKVGYWPKRLSNTTLRALTLSSLALGKYFAEDASLYTGTGPGVEVTRTSSATYFASGGKLTTAFYNRPRFDYDPVTNVCKGLLIEEQRTNLLQYSEQFNNAYWSKSEITIVSNNSSSPDKSFTANKIYPSNNSAASAFWRNVTANPSTSYSASVFIKAAGKTFGYIQINFTRATIPIQAFVFNVNLLNGSLGIQQNLVGTTTGATASVTDVGSGWYRLIINFTTTPTTDGITTHIGSSDTLNNRSVTANETNGIFVWGTQLEQGSFPTSYIPTTNAQVTRTADTVQIDNTNFSKIYNPIQGTFYTKALPLSGSQAAAVVDVGNTYNSIHGIWKSGPGGDGSSGTSWNTFSNSYFLSADAQHTPLTSNFVSTAGTANSASYIAYTYGPNSFATSISSTLISQTTDTSAVPLMQGYNYFNGHVQTLEYYNVQMTNQQLTALRN